MCVSDEERNYTVYMHVCKSNLKTYIGITCRSPEIRWGANGCHYHNRYFKNAIKKYGWDSFEHVILFENKTKKEAEELEMLFIEILLSNNRTYGYNISNGGNTVGSHSQETKLKMSESKKGREISEKTRQIFIERNKHQQKGKNSNAKKVVCGNKIFGTLTECSDFYNINRVTMNCWLIKRRNPPKKFKDLGLRYYNPEIDGDIEQYEQYIETENSNQINI